MIPRHLGTILQRYIAERRLSVREAARFLGTNPTKLDRYLKGQNQKVEPGLINGWLHMLGAPEEVIRDAEDMAVQTRSRAITGWGSSVPIWFSQYLELEARATSIACFSQSSMPGLLQTRAYMEAISEASAILAPGEIETAVRVRLARQELLDAEDGPFLHFIITEQCLRLIQSYDFYDEQAQHLLELNERERVSIFIVEDQVGLHASMGGPYLIMDFENTPDPDLVYLEFQGGAHYESSPTVLDRYRRAWSSTIAIADPIERSAWMSKWRKASRSVEEGECVELRSTSGNFLIRDSKLGQKSPVFGVDKGNFKALLGNLKQP